MGYPGVTKAFARSKPERTPRQTLVSAADRKMFPFTHCVFAPEHYADYERIFLLIKQSTTVPLQREGEWTLITSFDKQIEPHYFSQRCFVRITLLIDVLFLSVSLCTYHSAWSMYWCYYPEMLCDHFNDHITVWCLQKWDSETISMVRLHFKQ